MPYHAPEGCKLTPVPATVMDCFLGSGTTAVVAVKLGRNAIGCELSPKYVEMATRRIRHECGLLAEITVEKCNDND